MHTYKEKKVTVVVQITYHLTSSRNFQLKVNFYSLNYTTKFDYVEKSPYYGKTIYNPYSRKNQDKHKPSRYRPISVICKLSKTLKKIINNWLNWYTQTFKLFFPNQLGFRKFHSTTDCHIKKDTEVLEYFANKQYMILVSLDLQKAFGTIWRYWVLNILKCRHLYGRMLHFISIFLNGRSFQVKMNDHISKKFVLENGVPQESPLSILLFQYAMNNICDTITHPVKSIIFADDTNIYIKGKNVKSIIHLL